ncbi:MAG: hypothetical protein JNL50_13610 [Phycisphaerae bacterium]|nr:hypothetical protein [Phycisphaerae bacterium]
MTPRPPWGRREDHLAAAGQPFLYEHLAVAGKLVTCSIKTSLARQARS